MKKTLSILAATTALTAILGVPAYSSYLSPVSANGDLTHLLSEGGNEPAYIILASGDDDRRGYKRSRHDDDDYRRRGDDDDDDYEDDDDDDDNYGGRANPAPAGSVAPPKNGLFGNGAPKVQVN